jgi:hypothetical protein
MRHYLSTFTCLSIVRGLCRRALDRSSQYWRYVPSSCDADLSSIRPTGNRPPSPICKLNHDCLLNIFYLYRLDVWDDESDEDFSFGKTHWDGACWWYKLAQVCRRWRYLILTSSAQLDVYLLCTHGTPVASMLAHSPHLPINIYYVDDVDTTTAEDERCILLALQHHGRTRRIRLVMPTPKLLELMKAMDKEFPMLESLSIVSRTEDSTDLVLPTTFDAPHLCRLKLLHTALPVESPLLTTTVNLVILLLIDIPPHTYFHPDHLLIRLSLMPRLEILAIEFQSPVPCCDSTERSLLHAPITAHVTLPNLRLFCFGGTSTYLEALLTWISTPVLEELEVVFHTQLTFTFPQLLRFMSKTEKLKSNVVGLKFYSNLVKVVLIEDSRGKHLTTPLNIQIRCGHLNSQVASAAQILNALSPAFYIVEHLALYHKDFLWSDRVEDIHWRELLKPFRNVEKLSVDGTLIGDLFRSLQSDCGEPPLGLLPELKKLVTLGGIGYPDAEVVSFLDARQMAGSPVTLVYEP